MVLFYQIPLVGDQNDSGTSLPCLLHHLEVLHMDRLRGIDEDQAHVGLPDDFGSPQSGIVLEGVLHLGLATQTCGVHENECLVVVLHLTVHRISCGPRDFTDHDTLLSEEPVDEARLAYVGFADDGNADHTLVLFRYVRVLGKLRDDGVEEVARTLS